MTTRSSPPWRPAPPRFVGKDSKATEVVSAAKHAAVAPRTFLCTGLSAAVMRRATSPDSARRCRLARTRCWPSSQTAWAPGEIARRLYLSESTAKTHITHIYQKLGAANRAQALVTAMRLGLLDHALAVHGSDGPLTGVRGGPHGPSGTSHKGLPSRGRSPDSQQPRNDEDSS